MAFGKGGYHGGGRGRGRGQGGGQGGDHGGGQGNGQQAGGNTIELVVKGWTSSNKPHREQQSSVLGWLRSRSGCQILEDKVVKHHLLFIKISEKDKNRFFQLNDNSWQGDKITIEEARSNNKYPPTGPRDDRNTSAQHHQHSNNGYGYGHGHGTQNSNDHFPAEVLSKLEAVIRDRYDETHSWLNLADLKSHPIIQEIPDIRPPTDPAKVWETIFYLCRAKVWPNNHDRNVRVPSITLRANSITSSNLIHTLPRVFPRLRDLDLGDNDIQNMDALQVFKTEFRHLENLILDATPVFHLPGTARTLREWFPKLKKLNSTPIESVPDTVPPPIGQATSAPVSGVGIGTGIGQTPFRPDPRYDHVQAYQAIVDPTRPYHPEVPKDSYFAVSTPDKPLDILEREMKGLKFSCATKLNMATTEDCLKANHWDYDKAMLNFNELHAKGAIPIGNYLRF